MSAGFGKAKFGSSHSGFGTPSTLNSSVAKTLINEQGLQGDCPKIDPLTGDFVLDANGNPIGDKSINQMVYLAFRTLYNSSGVLNFGFDINTTDYTINDTAKLRVKLSVMNASKHLTKAGLINIVSVDVQKVTATGLQILIQWMDLSTNEINDLII